MQSYYWRKGDYSRGNSTKKLACPLRLGKMVTMRWFSLQVAVLSCIVAAWAQPLSFFKPVVDLGADDIERLRSGRVVTQTIHGSSYDLGGPAAGSLKTTP